MTKKMNIYIVDDLETAAKNIAEICSFMDHKVKYATCPRKAIMDIVDDGEVDLVFVDCMMPEMSGFELTSRLRGIMPNVRIVLMSGYADRLHHERILEFGAEAFLAKPISRDDIVTILENNN